MLVGWLAILSSAQAVDVQVSHGGYAFSYRVEPGDHIEETWRDLPTMRELSGASKRKRGEDLRVEIEVLPTGEDTLAVQVHLATIDRRGRVTTISKPTLLLKEGHRGELFMGREVPVVVSTSEEAPAQPRFLEVVDVRVLVGPNGTFQPGVTTMGAL